MEFAIDRTGTGTGTGTDIGATDYVRMLCLDLLSSRVPTYRMPSDRCSSSGTGIPHYQDLKLPSMQGECISQWVELCIGLTQVPFVNPIGDLKRYVQEVLGRKKYADFTATCLATCSMWSLGLLEAVGTLAFPREASSPGCPLFSSTAMLHGLPVRFHAARTGFSRMETMRTTARQTSFSKRDCGTRCAGHYPHSIHQVRVQIPQEMCGSVIDQAPNPDQASL